MWPLPIRTASPARPARGSITLTPVAGAAQLREGWDRVRRSRGGPGGDGVTVAQFAANLDDRLGRLSRELLADCYRPGLLRAVALDKSGGGVRRLAIPCVRDRVVQSALMLAFDRAFDAMMSGASFSYRQGCGLAINGAKTRIVAPGETWRFLGAELTSGASQ